MKTLFTKIAAFAFAASFSICASAQNIEQLVCRDQSVYEGFIREQKAGTSMSVFAEKATIVIKKSNIRSTATRNINVDALSEVWQQWVKENLPEGTTQIALKTFHCDDITYNDVYVIEDGSYVTILDLSKREYTIPWSNILSTTKTLRADNEFSGVNDVVRTKYDDKYVGQITEQCLGQFVKMRTTDGKTVSISPNDLVSTAVVAINDKLPLFSQTRLLDIIEVDGQKMEGIIVSREFGKILCLQLKDGRVRENPIGNVTTYSKRVNPDYVSLTDREIAVNEFYLDGEKAEMDTLLVRDIGFVLQDTTYINKKKGDKVLLEIAMKDIYHPVSAVKTVSKDVYKLNEEGKQDRSLGRETIIVAQYCDMVQSPLQGKRSVSPLGNINVEYLFDEEGIYVIYIKGMDKGLVIKVE